MSEPNSSYANNPANYADHSQSNLFSDNPSVIYGSFWERFAAIIIDGIILSVAGYFINSLFGQQTVIRRYDGTFSGFEMMYSRNNFFSFVINWLYFALMESGPKQASLGKMALGLRVTDTSGRRISFLNATGRYFAKIISTIILFIGFLMMLWDEKKQTLHDKLAGTLVIKA